MSAELDRILEAAHEHVRFGTVNLTIKKAHDDIVVVDVTKHSDRKVEGNAQALTLIGSLLKQLNEAETTGNLTFTISLSQGQAKKLITQDFHREMIR